MGGPFWKNKLFWFTDYQGTRQVVGASTGLVSGAYGRSAHRQSSAPVTFVDPGTGDPMTVQGHVLGADVLSATAVTETVTNDSLIAGCTLTSDACFRAA